MLQSETVFQGFKDFKKVTKIPLILDENYCWILKLKACILCRFFLNIENLIMNEIIRFQNVAWYICIQFLTKVARKN